MVQTLEEKVENLETNGGPGRAEAQSGDLAELRRQFAEFGEVQAQQSRTLDIHTGKLNALDRASNTAKIEMHVVRSGTGAVREEFSGRFERLDHDVAGLKGDFSWLRGQFNDGGLLVGLSQDMTKLRDDVTVIEVKVDTLQADVSGLKTDVADLKTNVAVLKIDVSELKADVSELKIDVSELKADVSELKADVSELKADVSELKADVSELKTDMVEVKGSLKEILDRLPAKAA
jgi:regulator of replication initiation timing